MNATSALSLLASPALLLGCVSEPGISIDGSSSEWAARSVLWEEPRPGQEPGFEGEGIPPTHVRSVSFDDDGTFLYVFLTLGPSLDERFLTAPFDDSKKFYLLIDTDNSVEELDEDSPFADSVPEYEVALRVYLFYEESWAASVAGASYSFYELLVHDHHVPSASPVETPESQKRRQSSRARNRLIAHGIAGVEMAVPLETMGVRKGQRVTAYLWDDARQRGDRRPIYDPFNYVTGGSDEAAGKP